MTEEDSVEIEQQEENSVETEQQEIGLQSRVSKRQEDNALKKIMKTAPNRFYPHLTSTEKDTVNRLKKTHPVEVVKLNQLLAMRRQAFWGKVKAAIVASFPLILVLTIAVLVIIIACVIINTLFPWLFPDDETGSKGAASPFGMKGDSFYGARVVYKDDEQAKNALIEQYVDIIETNVENLQAKQLTKVVNVGGTNTTFDVKLIVNLTMPEQDYNFEEMDIIEFSAEYPELATIVYKIAKIVYNEDNAEESTLDFEETLDGIKYFGFSETIVGAEIDSTEDCIVDVVYNALASVIQIQEKSSSASEYSNATHVVFGDLDNDIKAEIISSTTIATKAQDNNWHRTEKLFIKDIILEDSDSYIEGIEKKNYVALIYMAKTEVKFDYVSYMISLEENAEFSLTLFNNGDEIALSKGDAEKFDEDDSSFETYTYESKSKLNKTISATNLVNLGELDKFTSASSLGKVLANAYDYTVYLEETTIDGQTVLTAKFGNTYVKFNSDSKFMFNEEITY